MPSPETAVVGRSDLAESFMEFGPDMLAQGFIADRVLPVVEVQRYAGNFGKIPIEQLLKNPDVKRAPGSGYNRGEYTFQPATFACQEYGHEEPVDDRQAQMYADYFDAEMIGAMRARAIIMRAAEARAAALIFNATTWTGSDLTTGITHEWDDPTNATPINDVEAAAQKVWDGSGLWPNALIVNRKVFRNLRLVNQIIDKLKYQNYQNVNPSEINPAAMAQVFDLDMVLVAGAPYDSAKEGQSASISHHWSDEYAMICRVATTPDPREPCIGRTFHWGADGSTIGGTFESYREDNKRSTIIRLRHDVDELVLYTQAGHLLSNVTT